MKLLIAEDDLTSRTMLTAVTRKWGYEPVVTEDGEIAWQALQEDDSPRLMLLDWEMPRLSGVALCRRIRQRETNDPPFIILLTVRKNTVDIVAGLEAGANDYIAKPFDSAELRARLQVGQRMLNLQSELNRVQEKLAFQASHDPMTGLMNRRAVMELLEKEAARAQRQQQVLCVGICDLDHFKQVNDTYGHLIGDAVLQEAAKRMEATLRPYDHIGRYGGEEFLIVMNAGGDQALHLFESLRHSIADNPFIVEEATLNVSVSLGLAQVASTAGRYDGAELLAAADAALYEAKAAGRNRTVLADNFP